MTKILKYQKNLLSIFFLITISFQTSNLTTIGKKIIDILPKIEVHQIVLITNLTNNSSNSIQARLVEKLISEYPTTNFDYKSLVLRMVLLPKHVKLIVLNRSSVLFLTIFDKFELGDENLFASVLKSVSIDSDNPKFVLVFFSETKYKNYEDLLQLLWEKELLNVAVIEIISNRNSSYKIHQLNPFSNVYNIDTKASAVLFSNKVSNMHGYLLKTGIVKYPPYMDVITGAEDIMFQGPEGMLIRTLESTMNFSMSPKVRSLKGYGVIFPNGSATGLLKDLVEKNVDVIAFGALVLNSPFGSKVRYF